MSSRGPTAALPNSESQAPDQKNCVLAQDEGEQMTARFSGVGEHKPPGEPQHSCSEEVSSQGMFLAPGIPSTRVTATRTSLRGRQAPGEAKSLQLSTAMGSSLSSFSFPNYSIEIKYSQGIADSRSLPATSLNSAAFCQL